MWSPDIGSPLEVNNDWQYVPPQSTSIALSRDGKFIAVGDADDGHGTIGPNYPPIPEDASGARGSVYVFERKPSGWKLRRLMKPSVAPPTNWAIAVAIGAAGLDLMVGWCSFLSGATE